jgi:putative ABC transport system permease protein
VSRQTTAGGRAAGGGQAVTGPRSRGTNLTLQDMAALTDPVMAPDVAATAPVVTAQNVTGTYQDATHTVATFVGTTPSYFSISNDTLAAGSYFSDGDASSGTAVAVIGNTVAQDLVGSSVTSAVGQTIALNGQNFVVSGVLAQKGSSGLNDPDDIVVIPYSAAQDKFTGYSPSLASITVQAKSADVMNQAQNEVQMILDARHNVTSANRDYQVRNQAQILTTATTTTATLTILLGAVAGISLLVGGIGVMNIMLVSVTERTREIGIRKAIGARQADIILQFLTEAVVLTGLGGLIGMTFGWSISFACRMIFPSLPTAVPMWAAALGVVVSVAVGLFFGIWPANKAAHLDPVVALRYE